MEDKKNSGSASDAPTSSKKGSKRSAAQSASATSARMHAQDGLPTLVWVTLVVVALVLGIVGGHFLPIGGGLGSGSLAGKTTVSDSDLDSAIASYSYNGKKYTVSIRDAITSQSSLDAAKKEDGSYAVPSTETVLAYVRSAILDKAIEERGISVSDDEVKAFAEANLQTSDFDSLASSYGMDADTVKRLVTQSARTAKLRDSVVGSDLPTLPEAPTKPEEGKEDEATADYAQYIINLAGDEWDSNANGWKSTDGPYATALSNYTITNDSATYEAAQAAYYVAYQQYSTAQAGVSQQWTDFVNGLLSNAQFQMNTLVM